MLTIYDNQLNSLRKSLDKNKVELFQETIRNEHGDIYLTKGEEEWTRFINEKIEQSEAFEIFSSKNQFAFIILFAKYSVFLTDTLPDWAFEILAWPSRNEDDKLVLLYKEVYKQVE
jgi:hypothetical protein